jgi:hypothetical protein
MYGTVQSGTMVARQVKSAVEVANRSSAARARHSCSCPPPLGPWVVAGEKGASSTITEAPRAGSKQFARFPVRSNSREHPVLDDVTAAQVRELAVGSHLLEAKVRQTILWRLYAQSEQAVSAREILDLAEAFAWATNPGQAHGVRRSRLGLDAESARVAFAPA